MGAHKAVAVQTKAVAVWAVAVAVWIATATDADAVWIATPVITEWWTAFRTCEQFEFEWKQLQLQFEHKLHCRLDAVGIVPMACLYYIFYENHIMACPYDVFCECQYTHQI